MVVLRSMRIWDGCSDSMWEEQSGDEGLDDQMYLLFLYVIELQSDFLY